MSILAPYYDSIYAHFSKWIKVEDKHLKWTIEDFPYDEGANENLTNPHCWKCVTVNRCWFKNEQNKKPEHFDYSKYSYGEIPKSDRGIYHPHCHCKELAINIPKESDIKLILTDGKVDWVFKDKGGLLKAWGYEFEDRDKFVENFITATRKAYSNGNYQILEHTNKGVNISIFIEMPGIKSKDGRYYKRVTSFMVFPNGKLKNNTPIAKEWK